MKITHILYQKIKKTPKQTKEGKDETTGLTEVERGFNICIMNRLATKTTL
jgi:hypothetical protein